MSFVCLITFDVMSNAMINQIYNDENDTMLRVKIYCKHGDLLPIHTSWSKDNPGRRFWSCPHYRVCSFLQSWRLQISDLFILFFVKI